MRKGCSGWHAMVALPAVTLLPAVAAAQGPGTVQNGSAQAASVQTAPVQTAQAQQGDASRAGSGYAYAALNDAAADRVAASSPSAANFDVSPVTAAQAMDRLDPPERPFDVTLGASYADGKFGGATRNSIVTTALGLRYAIGNLRLTASLPWMRIRGNGTVFTGIDSTRIVVSPGTGPRVTHDGVGDLTLGAAYTVSAGAAGTEIELSGRVKLPTSANSDLISSNKTDYSLGVQLAHPIGRITLFGSGTFRSFGDPTGWKLKDGFAASAGSSLSVGDRGLLVLSYHFAQAASRFVGDAHELFLGASTRFPKAALRLTAFATAGLSSGGGRFSTGLSLAKGF